MRGEKRSGQSEGWGRVSRSNRGSGRGAGGARPIAAGRGGGPAPRGARREDGELLGAVRRGRAAARRRRRPGLRARQGAGRRGRAAPRRRRRAAAGRGRGPQGRRRALLPAAGAARHHGADGQHQPDHALQPGACLQQVLRQEGEGEAQQLPPRPARHDRPARLPRQQQPALPHREAPHLWQLLHPPHRHHADGLPPPCWPAARAVPADAHTAAQEEEQAQAQAEPHPGSCPPRNPLGLRPQEEKEEKRGGSRTEEEKEREEEKEEPAQPGAPGGGQLPGQQQQQLAVRPRRCRPGDPPADRNGPD